MNTFDGRLSEFVEQVEDSRFHISTIETFSESFTTERMLAFLVKDGDIKLDGKNIKFAFQAKASGARTMIELQLLIRLKDELCVFVSSQEKILVIKPFNVTALEVIGPVIKLEGETDAAQAKEGVLDEPSSDSGALCADTGGSSQDNGVEKPKSSGSGSDVGDGESAGVGSDTATT